MPLVGDVPAGSQLALIFVRHDNAVINSVSASFGSAGVISQRTDGGPRCAIIVVDVSDVGAEHVISLAFSGSGNGARVLAFVFLDELDTSVQANWLRDYTTVGNTTSATVDSEPTDLVLVAHGCWDGGVPSQPSGTTTLLAPFNHDNNDQRVVIVDEPSSPTTTSTSSGGNPSAAAVSIIWMPPAGGHATGVLRSKLLALRGGR